MRFEWLEMLRCPDDGRSPLLLYPLDMAADETVVRGTLECTSCHRQFPILESIASLLPREIASVEESGTVGLTEQVRAAESHGRLAGDRLPVDDLLSEMRARDREIEEYEATYHSRAFRNEIATCVNRLSPRASETILDVGCGTGRITRNYLDRAALVVAADFSLESLRYLTAHAAPDVRPRLFPVRAEISHLPFRADLFDAAISTSVFSNLPTAELREAGLAEIDRVLVPGGRLLLSVYNHCWTKRVRQRLGLARSGNKEGRHTGGAIHYYNFEREELGAWLSHRFREESSFGLNHRVPVLSHVSPALADTLDRVLAYTPFAEKLFAREIGTLARKPLS